MLKRVAANSLANGAVTVGKMAVSILLTPFLVNSLGPESYGLWSLVLSFTVSGFLSLFSLGIQAALVKAVAEHHARGEQEKINVLFSAALCAYSLLGLIAATFLLGFTYGFLPRVFQIPPHLLGVAKILFTIVAVQAAFDLPCMTFDAIVTGLQRFDVIGVIELIRTVVFATIVAVFVGLGSGLVAMVSTLLGVSVLSMVLYAIAAKRLLPALRLTRTMDWPAVWEVAHSSAQMFLLRINALVYGQMGKMIPGILLTTTVLTDYDVASRFHSLALVAMGLISSVVMPAASAYCAVNDSTGLKRLFLKGTKFSAALSLPITAMLIILAPPLLRYWIGAGFVHDSGLVYLFLAYTTFWVLLNVGWNMMIGMGLVMRIFKIQVLTTILTLIVSVVCTWRLGVAGVLWGNLAGNIVAAILYFRLFLPHLNVSVGEFVSAVIMPVYPRVALLGAGFALAVHARPPQSLLQVAMYGSAFLVTFAGWFLFTGLDEEEKRQLRAVVRQRLGGGRLMLAKGGSSAVLVLDQNSK